jgi:hypothetical protein
MPLLCGAECGVLYQGLFPDSADKTSEVGAGNMLLLCGAVRGVHISATFQGPVPRPRSAEDSNRCKLHTHVCEKASALSLFISRTPSLRPLSVLVRHTRCSKPTEWCFCVAPAARLNADCTTGDTRLTSETQLRQVVPQNVALGRESVGPFVGRVSKRM